MKINCSTVIPNDNQKGNISLWFGDDLFHGVFWLCLGEGKCLKYVPISNNIEVWSARKFGSQKNFYHYHWERIENEN